MESPPPMQNLPTSMEVDDGDLLHAVMAFLQDNDAVDIMGETSDSYGSSQSDNESSRSGPFSPPNSKKPSHSSRSPPTAKPAAQQTVLPLLTPRRPKINRSRERMREELVALREQVLELQDRLETAQGGVASRVGIRSQVPSTSVTEEREARKLRAMAWQALAEHENLKKQSAEQEREKLRALLKEQKLAFRRLRRYLGKYSEGSRWAALKNEFVVDGEEGEEENDAPPSALTYTSNNNRAPVDFEEITKAIPTMYMQTSAVFADIRLDKLTTNLRELKVQNELTMQMSIEALDSRLVPFGFEATAEAVWEFHLTKVRKLSGEPDKKIEVSDNCIRRVFSAGINLPSDVTGMARVQMETRRFAEPDRVVIIQSGIYDQMEVNKIHVDRFRLRQYQWTVIGPPRNPAMRASGKAISQVEVFEVTLPVLDHVSGMNRTDLMNRVKSLCQETAMIHMEIQRESVECILMDSLLKHSNLDSSMLQPPPTSVA